jgi:hypothetical protein
VISRFSTLEANKALLVGLMGVLVGLPYLGGGPVWDDHRLISQHLAQLPFADLPTLWWQPVGLGEAGAAYFRPLPMTVLALLGRLGIPAIHLVAALLHGLSSALFARRMGWMALVFALHPVASEPLGWASALPDVLVVTLALAANASRRVVPAALFAFLAVTSKEPAILLLVGLELWGGPDGASRNRFGAMALAVTAAFALRLVSGAQPTWDLENKWGLIPEALLGLAAPLSGTAPPDPVGDLHVLAPQRLVAGLLMWIWLGFSLTRLPIRHAAGVALIFAGALVISLGPSLHGWMVAERYAYPASLALPPMASILPGQLSNEKMRPFWALGVVAAFVLHVVYAPMWRTDRDLFEHAVAVRPQSAFAWHFLGEVGMAEQDWRYAGEAYTQALAQHPPFEGSRHRLVEAWVRAGQPLRGRAVAEAGPRSGLAAEDIAWWARACAEGGDPAAAAALLKLLHRGDHYDGPPWVSELASRISQHDG